MSFPRYPKYKDSGVEWLGQVPEHWTPIRYKNVFQEKEFTSGCTLPSGAISFGCVVFKNDEALNEATKATYQEVLSGEFLVNPINLNYDLKSLRTALSAIDTCVSPAYIVLKPKIDLAGNYFKFQLHMFDIRHMKTLGAGVRQTITFADIGSCFTQMPPLPEQNRIAAFLDQETAKIDELVAEQQRLMELLKEKRQAVISHAVTKGLNPKAPMKQSGIEWLGDVPEHWAVAPVTYRYGVQLGKMLDSNKITGEHLRPYLRVFDVQWGEINTDELPQMDFDDEAREKFRLVPGDLLVNEGGSYPGRAAIWSDKIDECYYQKALHRMRPHRPNEDTTSFFYYVMYWATNRGVFTAGGNEATIEHLPAEKLRRYRFPFPSIREQLEIADFLDNELAKFDALTAEAHRAIDLLQERRTALISAAVTGQIDVRQLPKK